MSSRRKEYRKGTLSADRIANLDAVPGWEWDQFEADYQRTLASLRQYVAREGHARVLQGHVETFDGDDIKLGTWVSNRRTDYRKARLSSDRVAALEAIDGWVWGQRRADRRQGTQ